MIVWREKSMSKLRTLAIIPAYNEALNIEKTVQDIMENAPDIDYVIVNDGSKDNTLEVLKKITLTILMDFVILDFSVLYKLVLN